jgi:uncharacterized protein (TIGR00159 family)
MFGLISIGFLTITLWDILDVLIVGLLLFQVYKLLRGSLGFNIFLGLVFVYVVWWLVAALEMPLLSSILGQFISVGMIALLIVFQPELRRFLILLGQGSYHFQRFRFLERLLNSGQQADPKREEHVLAIVQAIAEMKRSKTGALILITHNPNLEGLYNSGVVLRAEISSQLILSIFQKESPLHDGAVIISGDKIMAASCILPVSENPAIPQQLGLRHRAAIGATELSSVVALIVSEETGRLSYAREGRVIEDISLDKLQQILRMMVY